MQKIHFLKRIFQNPKVLIFVAVIRTLSKLPLIIQCELPSALSNQGSLGVNLTLTQQAQHVVGQLVGLGQHGGTGLLQDL